MILVVGIDAATWTVVRPNLDRLPALKKLTEIGRPKEYIIREKPVSPLVWCGMFSGKTFPEHGHDSFVKDGNLVKREEIKVDFIWDVLRREGKKVYALNVPFVVPPYSFGVPFRPVGFGLPTNEKEWQEELERITVKTLELMREVPDVLISVYTLLDRVQHLHWGEPPVLEWYEKLDRKLGELILDSGFIEDKRNSLIMISDHGFCSFGEAKVQTLPQKTAEGEIKGDHHENAFLITVNLDYEIDSPQDVFNAIRALTRA
ncbi:MAG: alkaline phosphatase family protein [Chloroflexota bacterium]